MKHKTDSEIEQSVLREFTSESGLTSKELCVLCRHGVVTLSGTAPDERNIRAAENAANSVPGVVRVVNRIGVAIPRVLTNPHIAAHGTRSVWPSATTTEYLGNRDWYRKTRFL